MRQVLNWTRGYLRDGGIVQPRLEAESLLAYALGVDRLHLYLNPDKPLTAEERARFREVIKRRRSGIPIQHLIGEVLFYGLRFRVTEDALIPRPETEQLVEHALENASRGKGIACLDLGTGAGVIAVCLARYLPEATVTAVDVCAEALELARDNAELNGVDDRITFVESNWFDRVTGRFDLVVSNPPYVAEEEMALVSAEVREHEPHVALDGGRRGIQRIEELTSELRQHLQPCGTVIMEIGNGQGADVVSMLEGIGLEETRIEKDLAGRERFVISRCPS